MPKSKQDKKYFSAKSAKIVRTNKRALASRSSVTAISRRKSREGSLPKSSVSSEVTITEIEEAYRRLAQREDDEIDRAIETIKNDIKEKKQNKKL